MFLVKFKYDYWCQGWEETVDLVLVNDVNSFEEACEAIKKDGRFKQARDFENMTIGVLKTTLRRGGNFMA